MADNTQVTGGTTGDVMRTVDRAGIKTQTVIFDLGGAGTESLLSSTNPLPITFSSTLALTANSSQSQPLTDTQLRASPFAVTANSTQSQPLTDTQLRASAVPVSLTTASSVAIANFPATYPVTDNGGSLTIDSTQLPTALAAGGGLKVEGVAGGVAVPVSGTFFQTTQPVSIATAVSITTASSLPVSVAQLPAALVSGRLDVNVGAATTSSTLPVSMAQLPAALVSGRLDINIGAATTSSTLPVSLATLPALVAGSAIIGAVTQSGTWNVGQSSTFAVGGDIAHDGIDAGNPVKVGSKAIIGAAAGGLPTAVAGNDRVQFLTDVYGRLAVRETGSWAKAHVPAAGTQATCNSTAQAAGVRNVCRSISVSLTSTAAPSPNVVNFSLYDGTTAGTVLWAIQASLSTAAGSDTWSAVVPNLWIEGTAATQMTLATAVATTTNVRASVAMSGTISQ